jgi:hypothetical protein
MSKRLERAKPARTRPAISIQASGCDGRIKKAGHTEAPEPAHQYLLRKNSCLLTGVHTRSFPSDRNFRNSKILQRQNSTPLQHPRATRKSDKETGDKSPRFFSDTSVTGRAGTMSCTWRAKCAMVSGERFNVCCTIADGICAMASACRARLRLYFIGACRRRKGKPMAAGEVIRQL